MKESGHLGGGELDSPVPFKTNYHYSFKHRCAATLRLCIHSIPDNVQNLLADLGPRARGRTENPDVFQLDIIFGFRHSFKHNVMSIHSKVSSHLKKTKYNFLCTNKMFL